MVLTNKTSQTIRCKINDNEIFLLPFENKNIFIDNDVLTLGLYHLYGSERKQCFGFSNVRLLVLDSVYKINGLTEDSVINITWERVHFELYYVYDRFFLKTENCCILQENYIVSNLESLCNIKPKSKDSFGERILDYFLFGNFLISTLSFLLFKMIFWANAWKLSWAYLLLFWVLGFLLQIPGEKIYYFIKNTFFSEAKELNLYSSNEYITKYYANPQRKWIGDNIEFEN